MAPTEHFDTVFTREILDHETGRMRFSATGYVIDEKVKARVATGLQQYLTRIVAGRPRIDRVSVGAKGIDSFLRKAATLDKNDMPKYADPLSQIQDQIGAHHNVLLARCRLGAGSRGGPLRLDRKM